MTRNALCLQNAVSITVANILHSVDFSFRWEYGWMLALETKKLAHSDRPCRGPQVRRLNVGMD
jgi:hypothetical protein